MLSSMVASTLEGLSQLLGSLTTQATNVVAKFYERHGGGYFGEGSSRSHKMIPQPISITIKFILGPLQV